MLNSKIIKIQPEVLEVTAEYDGIRLDRFIKSENNEKEYELILISFIKL